MKILILEDEIPAYQKLINYLNDFFTESFQHDWARSLTDGKDFLEKETYNFILSDIQLLDGISFDLFDDHPVDCPIVFCSAYDNYLLKAFNANGIAYILKPYTKTDFKNAINKYLKLFSEDKTPLLNKQSLSELKSVIQEKNTYKKRFVIKKANGIQLLNTTDISLIEAAGDFCIAIDYHGKRHNISQKLSAIKLQLNPNKFFKINRSQIINIDFINKIENHFKNRLLITYSGGQEKAMTSTAITSEFRKWLEK